MRTINLIDFCGQLLAVIQKNHSPADKITEYFFRQKRKIIGSKERKFISQTVFATIRNFILIKNIAQNCNIFEQLKHPKIFTNSPEHSVYILIQIILAEIFSDDFPIYETSFFHSKENFFNEKNANSDVINSINSDLKIIENSDQFKHYLNNDFIKNVKNYFSDIDKKYSFYRHSELVSEYPFETLKQVQGDSDSKTVFANEVKQTTNNKEIATHSDFIIKNPNARKDDNYSSRHITQSHCHTAQSHCHTAQSHCHTALDAVSPKISTVSNGMPCQARQDSILKNSLKIISERYSFPLEFLELLLSKSNQINLQNIFDFVEAMNVPASTCIRVNTMLSSVDEVIENLKNNNIESQKGKLSSTCIIVPKRHQLTDLEDYKKGKFVIQDEASQLVAFCANPKPTDYILDACAGAGGKSLHLADFQRDSGKIIASDIEFMKLKEIPKRAFLSGIKSIKIAICRPDGNIYFLQDSKKNSKPIKDKFDIVLVDAPCTGAGTLRRDPTKKYKITSKTLNKMSEIQYQILTNYSKYVAEGGFLLYSTCSIFSQENEMVTERFLSANTDFIPEPIYKNFSENGIFIPTVTTANTAHSSDYHITLFPFIHSTDGFFISKMKRQA